MDFGRLLAARQARLTETKMPVWLKIQKIDFKIEKRKAAKSKIRDIFFKRHLRLI